MVIKNNTFADFEDYFMKESVRLYGDGTLLEIDANEFVDPHNNLMDWNSFRVQEVGPKILFTNNQSTSNSKLKFQAYGDNATEDQVIIENNQLVGDYMNLYGSGATQGRFRVKDNIFDGTYLNVGGAEKALIKGNTFKNNNSSGLNLSSTHAVVEENTFQDGYSTGIEVYASFDYQAVKDTIRYNTITGNNSYNNDNYAGITINSYGNPVIWYNDIYDNNYYDIRNNSTVNDIDARFNWWGTTTTASMDAGSNPKDISKIYDYYDDNSLSIVNYGGWLGASNESLTIDYLAE